MGILMFVFGSLYLVLPALIANMAPVFVKKVRFLDYPLDFGSKWKGKEILGAHKTWRGLFFGIFFGIIMAFVQKLLFSVGFFNDLSIIDYAHTNFVMLGFLLGFGALFGDAVKSLFKRRLEISSGKSWIPFDQIDFVVGSLLFLSIIYVPDWKNIAILLVIVPLLHILVNHIGYYLGINKVKW